MITPSPNLVSTDLGRLHVRRTGTGPPVVLWHSLFVDSRSWGPLVDVLARDRTVYTIDGPSHGKSEAVHRDFAFEECVAAAEQALDRLGLAEPVDWVGNAWGGHVGIRLAVGPRLRTLTTIGTPVQAFTLGEKLTKGWPLVELYRFAGPTGFILKQLSDSLLGAAAIAAETGSGRDGHCVISRCRTQRHAARNAIDDAAPRRHRRHAAAYHGSDTCDVRA
jgi:pimeloyl-ACP methyl ester carboxylesterase